MKKSKKEKLEQAGWKVGDTQEFLGLSNEEMILISMKQKLMQLVRETRSDKSLTQVNLAEILDSSQSRVAKLENGASDVSLDLIVRALFAMGVSSQELGQVITSL